MTMSELRRLDREVRRLEDQRRNLMDAVERLKYAIAGGEDAPGFVMGQPVEMYEEMCRKQHRDNMNLACMLSGYHQLMTEAGNAPSSSEIWEAARRAHPSNIVDESA
jgi:hypothetical protein